jgi:signal transduction histidine kinase/DNA-binding response OmpR family regulator/HPt (histidine-containing phosphotransfer) domain-containing protein
MARVWCKDGRIIRSFVAASGSRRRFALTSLVDRGIAPELVARGGNDLRRLRLTIVVLLFGIVLAPAVLIDDLINSRHLAALMVGSTVVGQLAVIAVIRRRGWSDLLGHAMPEDRERCLAWGMDGYLSKPVKRRDLIRELRKTRCVRHHGRRRERDSEQDAAEYRRGGAEARMTCEIELLVSTAESLMAAMVGPGKPCYTTNMTIRSSRRFEVATFVDRWLASELLARAGDGLRRLRVTVAALLLSLVLVPLGFADNLLRGKIVPTIALGATMIGLVVVLAWVRRRGWSECMGHTTGICMSLHTVGYVLEGGDIHGAPILPLMAVPVAMFFLLGLRGGWVWCVASVTCFMVLGSQGEGGAAAVYEKVFMLTALTVGLAGVAHAFEALRRAALAEVEQARDDAQESAETKSQFLANMSHEIRTPMNGVLGMLGILLDTRLDNDQRSYAETAHGSGMALLDLLNDILDFSKMNAKQMVLEATPFDLRTSIEDVLDQVAVQAGKKDLELAARYVPGTPTHMMGDHGRIRQILLNLVSNAVKFTDSGHVLVTVEHTPQGDAPPMFRCSVEDTGIGIPAHKQALVFDVFRQVDGSTTRERAGTGLGLAIVRELVQLMGGRLGLESEPGKGSKFWFELALPLAVEPAPEPEPAPDLAGLRVLIVDDHWVNRWVLQEQLMRWGFRTEQCGSAERALELLGEAATRREPYDLAILDYQMPRMDGLGLARVIQTDALIRGTVLVMLSSITQRPSAEDLRAAGFAAYLVKPVHQSDLMNVLAAVWARRSDPAALPLTRPQRATSGDHVVAVHGLRVLVVEDNVVNQKVAQRMLLDLGCRVDVAADGQEALDLIAGVPYDVVFMDVQMPRMDGLEATAELRRREAAGKGHLRVVAMTAHAMPEDRERCLAAGMDGYLSKPVKRRDLIRELRRSSAPYEAAPLLGASETSGVMAVRSFEPACDLEWLRTNYAEDNATIRALVELFVPRAEELMEEMVAAERNGDAVAYGRSAHALKGICGSIRANRMFTALSVSKGMDAQLLRTLEQEYSDLHAFFVRTLGIAARAASLRRS